MAGVAEELVPGEACPFQGAVVLFGVAMVLADTCRLDRSVWKYDVKDVQGCGCLDLGIEDLLEVPEVARFAQGEGGHRLDIGERGGKVVVHGNAEGARQFPLPGLNVLLDVGKQQDDVQNGDQQEGDGGQKGRLQRQYPAKTVRGHGTPCR